MRNKIGIILFCASFLLITCGTKKNQQGQQNMLDNLYGKKIDLTNLSFQTREGLMAEYEIDKPFKIIIYVDSADCVPCKFPTYEVKYFVTKALKCSSNNTSFVFMFNAGNEPILYDFLEDYGFSLPFCVDKSEFHSLNGIPKNEYTNGLLLDENNRIILIGNPVQNPQIRDLYIRTICERLGVKPNLNAISKPHNQNKSLGTFSWQTPQTTTFIIHNTGNEPMLIDTIFTSCECTTAEIDKRNIEPTDSAIVKVSFKAERPEQFVREVYVGVRGKEQIVLSIEGEAVEI